MCSLCVAWASGALRPRQGSGPDARFHRLVRLRLIQTHVGYSQSSPMSLCYRHLSGLNESVKD